MVHHEPSIVPTAAPGDDRLDKEPAMSMKFKRLLPIPKEIREEMPLSAEAAAQKPAFDAQVAAIMRGEDDRRLMIVARALQTARTPCSTTSRALQSLPNA